MASQVTINGPSSRRASKTSMVILDGRWSSLPGDYICNYAALGAGRVALLPFPGAGGLQRARMLDQ